MNEGEEWKDNKKNWMNKRKKKTFFFIYSLFTIKCYWNLKKKYAIFYEDLRKKLM